MLSSLGVLFYFIKKDFKSKYVGSFLGVVWAVLVPVTQIVIFWFVFDEILKSRPYATTNVPYIYFLLSTILMWIGFSESITRASFSVLEHCDMIKKVSFPNVYLPIAYTVSNYVQPLLGFFVFLVFYSVATGFSPAFLLTIPVIGLQMIFTMGVAMVLSAIMPYVRDTVYLIGNAMQGLFFLSPIMYSLEKIPAKYRVLFYINPFAYFASAYHDIVLIRTVPKVSVLIILLLITGLSFAGGLYVFTKLKDGFSDIL
ncbi:MAG: ABC transporter permease [Nitrospirae bacterium]|nr:ABC transporter permease [Nitrospirota bacterium]